MTLKEKVICEAYTGICFCISREDRNELYKYLAEKMGRPVYSHEFATNFEKIKDASCDDFVRVCRGDYKETSKETVRQGEWIPVTPETMPKSEEVVLAMCRTSLGGRYVCCAFYVPAGMNNEDSDYCWDYESLDYFDEQDEFYVKEGWYERIRNWDDYGAVGIEDFVTHWMPLPEGVKEMTEREHESV